MKEPKPQPHADESSSVPHEASDLGGRKPTLLRVAPSDNDKPQRLDPAMQSEVHSRKARGRLGRDVLGKLGKTLEAYYDDVRQQGVPDRFHDLLRQFEERKGKEQG